MHSGRDMLRPSHLSYASPWALTMHSRWLGWQQMACHCSSADRSNDASKPVGLFLPQGPKMCSISKEYLPGGTSLLASLRFQGGESRNSRAGVLASIRFDSRTIGMLPPRYGTSQRHKIPR